MFKKRLLSLVLSASVLCSIALTGCGSTTKSALSTASAGTSTKSPASLTMWTWKVAYEPGFKAAAAAYEKKTGVKVNIQAYTPDATYKTKIQAAANSGEMPDIVHYWGDIGIGLENALVNMRDKITPEMKSSYYSTALTPLTATADQVSAWAADKTKSNVVKSIKEGDIYGLPLDMGAFFTIYYNKSILKEAGVDAKAPANWDAFIAMMNAVKAKTQKSIVISGQSDDMYHNWCGSALFGMYLGEEKFTKLLKRDTKMSDPDNMVPLRAFDTLVKNKLIMPGSVSLTIDQGDQAFASGKAAFDLGGTFTLSSLTAMGMKIDDVGTFTIPAISGGVSDHFDLNPFTLTMMSVSNSSKNKDAAYDFCKYITSDPDGAILFANGAYDLPALKLTSRSSELLPAIQNMEKSFSDTLNVISKISSYNTWMQHKEWAQYYKDLQSVEAGTMTIEQVAANFDKNAASEKAAGNN